MKRYLILFFVLCNLLVIQAQTLTLEQCQQLARENYPLIVQKDLIEKTRDFTLSNAKHNWLPQISINAQATYQSAVPALPDNLNSLLESTGITNEGLHKDQYKAAIQIEQLIYGGGAVKSQVEIARAES
ncbi:MAG: TolC family protein, partial [Prevotellaceae bacterium]|nr:TolC family protein [Prevotellaceae bacterium]